MAPNDLAKEYLVHSFLYYKCEKPIIPDGVFDQMCYILSKVYDQVTIEEKHLFTVEDLECGTGFHINQYPAWVVTEASRRTLNGR